MNRLVYDAADEQGTAVLGAALAEVLPKSTVVALCGTLGAGKTRLVQAIAEACGIDRREVTSPTFVLAQEYYGRRTIFHLDAYRLANPEEFLELGPEEYYQSGALVFIEWADRIEDYLPNDYVEIRIEVTGDTARRFEITAHGTRCAEAMQSLAAKLNEPA